MSKIPVGEAIVCQCGEGCIYKDGDAHRIKPNKYKIGCTRTGERQEVVVGVCQNDKMTPPMHCRYYAENK